MRMLKKSKNTTRKILTAFLKLCQAVHFAKTLYYYEIPKYYTCDNSTKQFNIRKQGISVSGHLNIFKADTMRPMYMIHPSNPECFF
jgi:hypothetical protein